MDRTTLDKANKINQNMENIGAFLVYADDQDTTCMNLECRDSHLQVTKSSNLYNTIMDCLNKTLSQLDEAFKKLQGSLA